MAKTRHMRNRDLHDALRDFAVEAAGLLRESLHSGAELEFDLEGGSGGGPTLYHYKPLTQKFIADRWSRIAHLPSFGEAAEALGSGASAFLRVNGADGASPEPALQAMLERLWEDMTDFSFPEDRFERVYAEVERNLFEKSRPATVLVAVHGIQMQKERVEMGDGLMLVRGDRTDAPDEAVWGEDRKDPAALLVLTREVAPEDPVPLQEARMRFRRMLTCLRLWKAGGIALAAVGWRRTGEGRWQPFELEATGAARGEPWIMIDGEEAELAQFIEAIEGVSRGGSVAWALSRFEMGCGRRLESEALSDYLLALRALVESSGDSGRSSLALRVAVLCAEENERKRVQRRIELAQALERFVMGDGPDDDPYLDAVGSDSPRTLVDEVERHLRALLRDVMCGYLDADLKSVADGLLLSPQEPFEIKASDVRGQVSEAKAPAPAVVPRTAVVEADPVDVDAVFDDDPASFSAPV